MRTEIAATAVFTFRQCFSATRRGARLARLLALHQLDAWGIPYDSELSDTAAALVAELASNAVLHARVAGRGFELRLTLREDGVLRIEVTDTRHDRPVREPAAQPPPADEESGRGLLLVAALAERWGVTEGPAPRKTVWAETHTAK
ncbi:ATP-binding protein [Streptomyces sp. E11-3]|uniref:ATP-binding protein n=1 Tax=Streptomyces sp. E11-3 TaxID=3110112 RepID=UPI00397F432B